MLVVDFRTVWPSECDGLEIRECLKCRCCFADQSKSCCVESGSQEILVSQRNIPGRNDDVGLYLLVFAKLDIFFDC